MGLINYTNLEDGQAVTANIFNERFGQIIAAINGGLDSSNFADGGIPAAALATSVYEQMYPVGSLYFNATDNTNPDTLLGFGTWVAFGAGKVPVGYDATDTDFNAAEKTGGTKTTSLTIAQLPSHTHVQDAHFHTQYDDRGVQYSAPGYANTATVWAQGYKFNTGSNTQATTATNQSTGSGEAHSNLAPFITVYIFKRTA